MNLFGRKKKAAPAPKVSDTIRQLRGTVETLDKREDHLQKQVTATLAKAKEMLKAKNQKGAKLQMKRKALYEKQIEQIFGKKVNLETQIAALEDQEMNKQVFTAMKTGTSAMKSAIASIDADAAAEVMDDFQDYQQDINDINDALSQPISGYEDDEDIDEEIAAMEEQLIDEQFENVASPVHLPAVATGPIAAKPAPAQAAKQNQEDADLAELEAIMS